MSDKNELPGWVGGWVGSIMAFTFLGMGLFIILSSLNIIPSPDENFQAPRSIVAAAGLVFFLAGFLMLMGLLFSDKELRHPILLWTQFLLVLTVMLAFSGVFLWTGLGPGEREFQSSVSVGPVTTRGEGDEGLGRILFGGMGILCSLGTAWYAVNGTNNLLNGNFQSIFDQNRRE